MSHDTADLVSHKGGRVDRNGSGRRLGNRNNFQNVLFAYPPFVIHHFPLNERDHGITAAEGEGADFEKGPKEG